MKRFWDKVDKSGDCWEWTANKIKDGYGRIGINGKHVLAHRFVMELEGHDIDGKLVCHHCDNPGCVRPDHLFVGTASDNMKDMVSKGRMASVVGSDHPNSKLCDGDIPRIRDLYRCGAKQKDIAEWFDVSLSAVNHVCSGKNWGHV